MNSTLSTGEAARTLGTTGATLYSWERRFPDLWPQFVVNHADRIKGKARRYDRAGIEALLEARTNHRLGVQSAIEWAIEHRHLYMAPPPILVRLANIESVLKDLTRAVASLDAVVRGTRTGTDVKAIADSLERHPMPVRSGIQ